ncbi:MAG TPA: GspH/FimT family pseudopilin [Hyphomicrobiaceae bacterium]|jgi:general secretion pathway protein H
MPRPWREYDEAGFTLLELLIVLSLLALIAAMAVPALTAPSEAARLRAAAEEIAAAMRLARAAAIARNGEAAVVIDTDRRSIHAKGAPARTFGADIAVALTIAESERRTAARGGFRFFADGSSTGGDIVLRLNGRELRLCVDWLTGRTRQGAEC